MTDWKRLFAYDDWANRQTVASLRAAASAGATGGVPEKARKRLSHLLGAGWLWLSRLESAASPPPAEWPVWPDLPLEDAALGIEELARTWDAFVSSLDEAGLARTITYTNSKGEAWSSRVSEVLMHVVLHGGYHRGQIASDLREAGFEPAYTDYIEAARRGWI